MRGAKREPGRAKHQERGGSVNYRLIGGLNDPLFLVSPCRAHIRSAHARLRQLRWLREIFLVAQPPLLCQRGEYARTRSSLIGHSTPKSSTTYFFPICSIRSHLDRPTLQLRTGILFAADDSLCKAPHRREAAFVLPPNLNRAIALVRPILRRPLSEMCSSSNHFTASMVCSNG